MSSETVPWWHVLHRWTRWEQRMTSISQPLAAQPVERLTQTRQCVRCHVVQIRLVRGSGS